MNDNKWNIRFMELAISASKWSKDPSSKVGAVIVDEYNRIVSTGYNGFPRGVIDNPEFYLNKEIKYQMVLHAEENAILFAKRDLKNCKIYVSKIPPCSHCSGLIIQSGITEVYYQDCEISERWKKSFEISKMMFQQANVQIKSLKI